MGSRHPQMLKEGFNILRECLEILYIHGSAFGLSAENKKIIAGGSARIQR
jgi:hypothetical protein